VFLIELALAVSPASHGVGSHPASGELHGRHHGVDAVDEIRVKVGQNLRFGAVCYPEVSQQARL